MMGAILLRRTRYEEAKPFLDISLELAKDIKDDPVVIEVLYDLGGWHERQNRTEDAIDSFTRSMELSKAISDHVGLGKSLYGLGRVYLDRMDKDLSMTYMKEALNVLEKTGDVNEIAKVCTSIGLDLIDSKRYDEALRYHTKAIELAKASGNYSTLIYAMSNAVACYLEMGELKDAEDLIGQASSALQKLNDKLLTAIMHLYRGFLYSRKKEWEWAKEEFKICLDMLRQINMPQTLGRWLLEIGQEYHQNDDNPGAIIFLEEALRLSETEKQENLRREVAEIMDLIRA